MASNRYTTLSFPGYQSQHVPLPLEGLFAVGQQKQKQADDAVNQVYKLEDLMTKVNAIHDPTRGISHLPIKQQLDQRYTTRLNEITDRIVNKGDLSAVRDVTKIAREFQNDPQRVELETSYANYLSDVKDELESKQKGVWTDVYNPFRGARGLTEEGQIVPYRAKGVKPIQDYLKVGQELMKDIAKSGNSGKSYKIDESGNVIGLQSGWEAVYQQDIDRVAQNSIVPFLKSKEGEFFLDEIKYRNPKAGEEEILSQTYEYLRSLANKQKFEKTSSGRDFDYAPEYIHNELKEKEREQWETSLSKMGEQGVAALKDIEQSEPTNSILAKIINFVNPNNQAAGLINIAKSVAPSLAFDPSIAMLEKQIADKKDMSLDEIDKAISKARLPILQAVADDQKRFKETFGFPNPVYHQAANIIDNFTNVSEPKQNAEYNRAKEIVSSYTPNFNSLSPKEQYKKIKEEIDRFAETSKSNVTFVPMDKKELDFKNQQLMQFLKTGDIDGAKQQLINNGLSANGKFIDYLTGKEMPLEDVIEKSGIVSFTGELDNNNQFGAGMNYFQGADGSFYVSPGSLNSQKDNYLDWNLNQYKNKFNREHEFPIDFNARNVAYDEKGKVKEGIPKVVISENLKTGGFQGEISIGSRKGTIDAPTIDELRKQLSNFIGN